MLTTVIQAPPSSPFQAAGAQIGKLFKLLPQIGATYFPTIYHRVWNEFPESYVKLSVLLLSKPGLLLPSSASPESPPLPSFLLPVRRSPLSTKGNFQGYGARRAARSLSRGLAFAATIPCK